MNKEGIAGAEPGLPVSGQAAAGNEVMNVGMVGQIAGPGLQHPQQTDLTAEEARVVGQFLQSRCRSLKQEVIYLFLGSTYKKRNSVR